MKKFLEIVFFIAGFIGVMIPFVAWVMNPDLTALQLIYNYWYYILSGMISLIISGLIVDR